MTTQRRPHWDDDLVRTVADLIQHGEQGVMDYVHRAHIIIAAVEDWHKAKRDRRDRTHSDECWRWHQECAGHLIERQRSTIQRVRELHAPIRVDLAGSERCGYCAILPWPCDTIRAIEGDNDD